MQKALFSVSLFTLVASCWLAVMEMVLHHPGFVQRIALALCIATISTATLLTPGFLGRIRLERWFYAVGAMAMIAIGVQAFLRNARAAHFEGFVFVMASAIVLQGLLMVLSLAARVTHSAGATTL